MALDSLTDTYLASPTLSACFGAEATVAQMLAFEAALAATQARLGLIPDPAARTIEDCCRARTVDVAAVLRDTAASSTPAIPLVQQLTLAVATRDGTAAHYVHWGATTQDIMDMAVVLQIRAALQLIEADIAVLRDVLADLSRRYRDTPMAAAICRSLTPTSNLRRRVSLILRMDNLACATGGLLPGRKRTDGSGLSR